MGVGDTQTDRWRARTHRASHVTDQTHGGGKPLGSAKRLKPDVRKKDAH